VKAAPRSRASSTPVGDRRLKVLFIPGWYPSPRNPLAGTFVREHARAAALYDDVTVLYVQRLPRRRAPRLFSRTEEMDGAIRTVRVNIPRLFGASALAILASCERLLRQGYRPDVIHAHVYHAGVPAALLSKLHRIPLVVTEHWTGFPMRELSRWGRLRAGLAFGAAQRILPVSSSLQRAIEGYGIRGRFTIVPNTVDTDLFRPKAAVPAEETKNLVCVSILDQPRKGIHLLLDALARVKQQRTDFHLHIVGEGPRRAEYEGQADRLGLRESVTFHGKLDAAPLVALLQQAAFYVLPSLFENFSVATAEALATGTPVLATRCGGPEDFVTPEVGKTIPPGDVAALAEGILSMLDTFDSYNPSLLGAYARDRFSHRAVGARLHEIYREAVATR
jgi:glycosyltransferase involved in cell wall biosynthesis